MKCYKSLWKKIINCDIILGQIINFVNIFSAFILESCMRMEVKCQGMKYCMNIF